MKKFLVQSALLVVIIFGALIFANPTGNSKALQFPFLSQPTKTADLEINGQTVKVEIADNKGTRKKGLGGRSSLADDQGMLFIFDNADKYPFWMKGMTFALDFVWIKDDTVLDILENVPAPKPGQADASLPVYSSNVPINKVLEVNAGVVARLKIKISDKIKLNQ